MTARSLLALVFLLAFLASVAATVPADWALRRASAWAGDGVALEGIGGTVWDGSVARARLGTYRVQDIAWSVAWPALLSGDIRVEATYGDGTHGGRGVVVYRPLAGTAGLASARARVPADIVHASMGDVLPVPLTGTFRVAIATAELDLDGRAVTALDGRIAWRDAALALEEPLALGTPRADLAPGPAGGVSAALGAGVSGPLAIDGEARLAPNGAVEIGLDLAPRDGADPRLETGLAALGRAQEEGQYRLDLEARLVAP